MIEITIRDTENRGEPITLTGELGINTGYGSCPDCEAFLHITFDEERQEMDLERYESSCEQTRI